MSTWDQYKELLWSAPNHDISDSTLVLSFYRALNMDNQVHVDALIRGSILAKPFAEVADQFDKLAEIQRMYKPKHEQPTKYKDTSDKNRDQAKINVESFLMLDQSRANREMLTKQTQGPNTLKISWGSDHVKNVSNEEESEKSNWFMFSHYQCKRDGSS